MLYEILSLFFGIFKIILYKFLYPFRIFYRCTPKINKSFKIAIKRGSKLIIGKNFRARNNVSFRVYNKGMIVIGDGCFMNDGCSINCQQKITIGNNVIFGQNVLIFDHDHDYKNNVNDFIREEVIIGDNVWIGANVVILKGVKIGSNVVVAANSIVRKDIPSNMLFYQEKQDKLKSRGR